MQTSIAPPRVAAERIGSARFLIVWSTFLFVIVLLFARLGSRELYSSHEARAAQNAQRMLDTGEWGLPVLFDGRVDLQKPPAYYWMVATIGWLNGGTIDEWATRFPSAISGLFCVAIVFSFLRSERRMTAAIVAALVLATANHFTAIARTARIDIPLTLMVTTSLFAYYRGCATGLVRFHFLAAVAAGLAVLLKGPVALALIGPVAVVWLIVERPRVPLAARLLGPLVVAAIAVPWFVWANTSTDGELFRVFFWHHTIARFTGSSQQLATHPWWYYAPRFALDFLPWTPVLIGLIVWGLRTGCVRSDPLSCFGLVALVVMIVVMSTARFKRADYLLPAYPFAALAVGCAAETWLASRSNPRTIGLAKRLFGATLAAVAIGWIILTTVIEPAEQARESRKEFARAIRTEAPAPHTILQFRMESHLLSFHLGRPVHTFVEWGELNERLAVPGRHFVVMPPEYVFAADEIVTSRKLVVVTRLEAHTAGQPSRPLVFLRTAD